MTTPSLLPVRPADRRRAGSARLGTALGLGTALAALLAVPAAAAPAEAGAAPSGACPDETGVTVVVDAVALGGELLVGCATEPATGTEALTAAGFTEARDPSGFICAVGGLPDPCPTEFTGEYWSYWTAEAGGEWVAYTVGSDEAQPAAGSVEGWAWGDGSTGPAIPPPVPGEEAPVEDDSQMDEQAVGEGAEEAPADDAAADEAAGDEQAGVADDVAEEVAEDDAGVSPAVLIGVGALLVGIAVGLYLVARRSRSPHGPAGQS